MNTQSPFPTPPASFHEALAARGVELDSGDLPRLGHFLSLLQGANAQFNLTAIKEPEAMWTTLVQDSLMLAPLMPSATAAGERLRVCDVGSGGGVPALPLACVLPECEFTLIESTGKKADFLARAAVELGLSLVRVIRQRAEIVGQDKQLRESFDVCTARGLALMPTLLELCLPLVRPGGVLLAVKGEKAQGELDGSTRALGELRGRVVELQRTPTGTIVIIEKTGRTPRLYPRMVGEPTRRPV